MLAGGEGRRMGGPKALLRVNGVTLLEDAVSRAGAGAAEVLVAAPASLELPPGGRRVFDRGPGLGPLAGIEAGLAAMASPVGVVVAVDMPRVDAALVARLARAAAGHDAAVPRAGGRAHATCAAYSKRALPALTAALDAGSRRLTDLLDRLDVAWVDDVEPALLTNLNYPEDLKEIRR